MRKIDVLALILSIIAIIIVSVSTYMYFSTLSELYKEVKIINQRLSNLEFIFTKPTYCPEVKYAKLFSIKCDGPVKIVRDALNRTILLIPKNLSVSLTQYFISKYRPDVVIKIPTEKIVLFSSTQVALIWRIDREYNLGLLRKVVAIAWGQRYRWYIPEIKKLIENGTIIDIGYADSPDYEKLITLKPDLVVIYTIPGYEPSVKLIQKLEELKIPYVVDNEWMESTFLGRFEWIKFLASFFNLDEKVSKLFNKIVSEVENIRRKLSEVKCRPGIAWFIIYRGIVWTPRPGSYVHDLIRTCSGIYLYENVSKVDLEVVISLANKTDILIYSSYLVESIDDILKEEPRLEVLKAIREGRVYAFHENIWQVGYAYPEILIKDLCYIVHSEIFREYELHFFKRLT
ncbi:MAG: ABC transporter substrate-binding protein [Thermoprotei archaeon ex4572_64]|nr:MAG: ABC transporter substrate-binding protein [Thermoprotei archaeon ex4572_64]